MYAHSCTYRCHGCNQRCAMQRNGQLKSLPHHQLEQIGSQWFTMKVIYTVSTRIHINISATISQRQCYLKACNNVGASCSTIAVVKQLCNNAIHLPLLPGCFLKMRAWACVCVCVCVCMCVCVCVCVCVSEWISTAPRGHALYFSAFTLTLPARNALYALTATDGSTLSVKADSVSVSVWVCVCVCLCMSVCICVCVCVCVCVWCSFRLTRKQRPSLTSRSNGPMATHCKSCNLQ